MTEAHRIHERVAAMAAEWPSSAPPRQWRVSADVDQQLHLHIAAGALWIAEGALAHRLMGIRLEVDPDLPPRSIILE